MVLASLDTGNTAGLQVQVVSSDNSDLISTDNVKSFLRVDYADDDYLIQLMTSTAIDWIEQYCGIALRPKTIIATYNSVSKMLELPYGPNPVISTILDSNGNALTYTQIGTVFPQFQIISYSGAASLAITYTTGYVLGTVPAGIIQALLKIIATDFDNRANITVERAVLIEYSNDAKSLLGPYRRNISWL